MAKQLIKDGARLFGLCFICSLIAIFIVPMLNEFQADSQLFQWSVILVLGGVTWVLLWGDVRNIGKHHYHLELQSERRPDGMGEREVHVHKWYGFAVMAISQAPMILFTLIASLLRLAGSGAAAVFEVVLRGWYMTFAHAYMTWESAIPYIFFIIEALFILIPGTAYMSGITLEKNNQTLLKRNREKIQSGNVSQVKTQGNKKAKS